ncbi:MAG TPA: glycosyltransferase family 39 protein [Anaerolineales bacterium]|nr:glycosyltransferase family 39 protein [Anaerolineales bacterium]
MLISRWELWLLALIVILSLAIRIYRLGTFPDTVLADEADNVQTAARILLGHPPANGFFGLDWTQQPAFSAYKQALFLRWFGFTVIALRLPSAVISALALIPFYLILRRQFSRISSLGATILLSTNVWYLNFSRSGWNCIDAAFYMLSAMVFLLLALDWVQHSSRGKKWGWLFFCAAGVSCALGLYGYPAGRAITVALLAFFPLALAYLRHHRRAIAGGFAALFMVEAILFAPQAAYVAGHWQLFNGRTGTVAIINDPAFRADPVGTMWQQLGRNLRGPWDGSVNRAPQYSPTGEPQLNRLAGALALAGMLLSIFSACLRNMPETWLWWLMLLTGWGTTQLLTVGTPNGARGIGYMPTLFYFVAAALDWFLQTARVLGREHRGRRLAEPIVAGIAVLVILATGVLDVRHYASWQSEPATRQARYLYLTTQEFPRWATRISEIATSNGGVTNLSQWRQIYPIPDPSNPIDNP